MRARRALWTKLGLLAAAVATATLGLAPLAAADASPDSSIRTIAPPSAFRSTIERMQRHTAIAILLPAKIRIEEPRGRGVEINWHASKRAWSIALGIGPRCGGANACFVGAFSARRGGKPAFRRKVSLHGGTTGWFKRSSCGASCAPPEIQWVDNGVLYAIQMVEAGPGSDRRKLVALANSALAGGPR
ncbi:MAG TPA: hypothetical protein VGM91_15045 [Conexibacter sp.]|jgi:hypothetical protein